MKEDKDLFTDEIDVLKQILLKINHFSLNEIILGLKFYHFGVKINHFGLTKNQTGWAYDFYFSFKINHGIKVIISGLK